jgi:diamine N-acetyltransferase
VTKAWGLPRLSASVVDRSGSALAFYEKLGFRKTGRVVDGEAEIVREIP